MKVKTAAQTLNNSVSDSIDFLRDDYQITDFSGSETIMRFLRIMDKVFDLLNSRHPKGDFESPDTLSHPSFKRLSHS